MIDLAAGATVTVHQPQFRVTLAPPRTVVAGSPPNVRTTVSHPGATTFTARPPDTGVSVLPVRGPPGPPGTSYVHEQTAPSASWLVQHNLQRYPAVVLLVSGEYVTTDITYLDENALVLTFPQPVAGFAYL